MKELISSKAKRVNNILPYAVVFLSLSLLIFLLYRGAIHAPLLLPWIIGGSFLYILLNRRGFFQESTDLPRRTISQRALAVFFFALFSLTLLLLLDKLYVKPVYYFVFVSAMGVIIGLQILPQHDINKIDVYLILSQIFVLSLVLSLSSYLVAPPFIGSGDIWYSYYNFELPLLETGHIPPGLWYSDFPVFSLLNSMVEEITLVHPMMHVLPVSLFLSFGCVFVFLIGREITGTKIGLMAALFFVFMPYVINWSGEPNAMSLSLALLLVGIYLYIAKPESLGYRVMFLIILLSATMSHTLGSIVLVLFLLVDLAAQASESYFKNEGWRHVAYTTALLGLVLLFGYWMYVAKTFFINTAEFITGSYAILPPVWPAESVGTAPVPSIFMNHLGIYIIFFFSIIGGLLLFKANSRHHYAIVYLCSALFIWWHILASEAIAVPVVPYRLEVFLQGVITIPFAMGFVIIFDKMKGHARKLLAFALVLAVVFFFSVTSEGTGDESAPFQTSTHSQMTYSELGLGPFAGEVIFPTEATAFCDPRIKNVLYAVTTIESTKGYEDGNVEDNGYFFIRPRFIQEEIGIPVKVGEEAKLHTMPGRQFLQELSDYQNKIYDNGGAQIYYSQ